MSEKTEMPAKNLFQKMASIMGEVKRLKKTGYNNHQKYKFATHSDVYDLIRELLAENGVGFFASIGNSVITPLEKGYHVKLDMEFTFACGDSGMTFTSHWIGEAIDYGDKGVNKAATSGEKYFLLNTFVISTGDTAEDTDSDSPIRTTGNKKRSNSTSSKKDTIPFEGASPSGDDDKVWNMVKAVFGNDRPKFESALSQVDNNLSDADKAKELVKIAKAS